MKKYLLDTNTVSYFVRSAYPNLQSRMQLHLNRGEVAISVLTRAELKYGQALMTLNDKRHKSINAVLEQLPTLLWTIKAADQYGELKARLKSQGNPIGELDTQVAAHALTEDLTLVTHNTRHFSLIANLKLEDWAN
jgi:tRNA(fMet)-specific endonuclease VapC